MTNKLNKVRHPRLSYYSKRIGLYFSIFIGASILVAIPVTVAATIKYNVQVEKDQKEADKEKKKEISDAGLLIY